MASVGSGALSFRVSTASLGSGTLSFTASAAEFAIYLSSSGPPIFLIPVIRRRTPLDALFFWVDAARAVKDTPSGHFGSGSQAQHRLRLADPIDQEDAAERERSPAAVPIAVGQDAVAESQSRDILIEGLAILPQRPEVCPRAVDHLVTSRRRLQP